MKIKKIIPFVFFAMVALNTSSVLADKAELKSTVTTEASKSAENKLSDQEVKRLTDRLLEIRDMDKKNLTSAQKRDLREEVKGIRDQLKGNATILFIPVSLIIIVLLLIILL